MTSKHGKVREYKSPSRDILSFFPPGRKPRDIQVDVLRKVETAWEHTDVFVISMPTGTGKSFTSYTLARYAAHKERKGASIIVPNNLLIEQYKRDFSTLHTLARKDSYSCHTLSRMGATGEDTSCSTHKKHIGEYCSQCPYREAVRKAYAMPYGVYNFHTYLAYKLHKPTLIVDEAHTLLPLIQEMNSRKLWYHDYQYPHWVSTYGALARWIATAPPSRTLQAIHEFLEDTGKPRYVVERGTDLYRGEERELLRLVPVDTSASPPLLWPSTVKKIFLLSATFSHKDLEQLGLSAKRVTVIDVTSPIDKERRPVVVESITPVSYANKAEAIPKIASRILELADFHLGQKGLIHVPYSIAEALASQLVGNKRILFHTRENKREVFDRFRMSPPEEGKVLVACGMWEGIDLPYEEGRWQVIAKVPWPSLAEPAIRYKAEEDEEWYMWQALRTVMQGAGRVCRGVDDYGVTYILDSTFERILDKGQALMPEWFREAIVR